MKATLLSGVFVLAAGSSGCGLIFGSIAGPNGTRTERVRVPVETEPPGAEVFEKSGDKYVPHGVSPTTVEVTYETKDGYTPGLLAGYALGTAVDVGLTYWSWHSYQNAKSGGRSTAVPVTGLVVMGAAILCDALGLIGAKEEPLPAQLTVLARAPNRAEATRTISVPGVDAGRLSLTLAVPAVALSEHDMQAKSLAKRQLGKILVLDIKPGRAVAPDLGRIATNMTAAEMQRYSKDQVIGKADVDALLSAQKSKDLLDCSDTTCASDIGGMLGTDIVLAGDIEALGSYLVISYRMVNSKKATVVGRVSHRVKVEGDGGARASEDALVNGIPAAIEELLATVE
jgi:hypothetical protein